MTSEKNIDTILRDTADGLFSFFNGLKYFSIAEEQILKRIKFDKQHEHWPADVIKKAWKETEKNNDKKEKKRWARVIAVQLIKHLLFDKCKGNPAQEDSRATGAAGGVHQRSEGKRRAPSFEQTPFDRKRRTETTNTGQRQTPGNNRGGTNRDDRTAGALQPIDNSNHREDKTFYIRVPIQEMVTHEQDKTKRVVPNNKFHYKLIDRHPGTGENSEIRRRKSYVMSFNRETRNADWVYELLNKNTIVDNHVEAAPFGRPYHKGHLAAAANHRWCREASNDADMIDNIVPQHKTSNTGPWLALEKKCQKKAREKKIRNVHVYSGPLYLREMNPQMIQEKRVPSDFFKVIIQEYENGIVKLKCYQIPNGENLTTETEARIEDIQRYSGLIFKEPRLDVRQNAEANQITVRLHGEDGNAVERTAVIQVTTLSFF